MVWSLAANLQGPAGPSAVSADAGNSARLGTDAKVFVPPSLYVLPVATAKVLGGIKVGAGLSMTADGVLSAAMATTYVNKAGDVMNGPLLLSLSRSPLPPCHQASTPIEGGRWPPAGGLAD